MRSARTLLTTSAALACVALPVATADAASRLTIRGAGFGHGVGMSQYGAYGYALHGADHARILGHYYTGTDLGQASSKTIRVLLQGSVNEARVSGARSAAGRRLSPRKTYRIRRGRSGGTVDLLSPSGRRLKRVVAPLRVVGSGARMHLAGSALNGVSGGAYRGALEFRPSVSGLQAVNALSLDDYVRGVIARESPSSWPIEALKAQAVAARTYAITTSKGGYGFDQYPDTRSQVYGGVSAETAATDRATAETAGEVVTYDGKPVVTYFFSTSGGRTEDVEKSALGTGGEALPWLRSVDDPYDDTSPKHRWGPYRHSLGWVDDKLGSLVKGSFRGIKVRHRGSSPRIMTADVIGSRGRTRVSGATLRSRLGLYDSWAYFTTISTKASSRRRARASAAPGSPPEARAAGGQHRRLTGRVFPQAKASKVRVQRRIGRHWHTVGTAETGRRGRYAFAPEQAGRYRVKFIVDAGPTVRVR